MSAAPEHLVDEATPWVDEVLAGLGRARTGAIEIHRERPWAIVAWFPTKGGRVWLKANHEAFGHEGELLQLLADQLQDTVLEPLAVHAEQGWFLADDGGPTADEEGAAAPPAEAIVDLYVRTQQASTAVLSELAGAGVPTLRTAHLIERFDAAVAHPLAGDGSQRCASLRETVLDLCGRIGDGDLVITNSDVKPSHVFVGPPPRLFDWGDAVLANPLLGAGTIRRSFGDPAMKQFVEAWGRDISSPAVAAATSLVDLVNLDVWLRDPSAALDRHPGQINKLLHQLADRLAQPHC